MQFVWGLPPLALDPCRPPAGAEHGGTCTAESTSMGRSAREGLAVTAFLKMSWALSVCETSALSDSTAAVMI